MDNQWVRAGAQARKNLLSKIPAFFRHADYLWKSIYNLRPCAYANRGAFNRPKHLQKTRNRKNLWKNSSATKSYWPKHQPSSATRTICGNQFIIFGRARLQIAVLSTDPNICRKPETEKICGKIVPRQNLLAKTPASVRSSTVSFGRAAKPPGYRAVSF